MNRQIETTAPTTSHFSGEQAPSTRPLHRNGAHLCIRVLYPGRCRCMHMNRDDDMTSVQTFRLTHSPTQAWQVSLYDARASRSLFMATRYCAACPIFDKPSNASLPLQHTAEGCLASARNSHGGINERRSKKLCSAASRVDAGRPAARASSPMDADLLGQKINLARAWNSHTVVCFSVQLTLPVVHRQRMKLWKSPGSSKVKWQCRHGQQGGSSKRSLQSMSGAAERLGRSTTTSH